MGNRQAVPVLSGDAATQTLAHRDVRQVWPVSQLDRLHVSGAHKASPSGIVDECTEYHVPEPTLQRLLQKVYDAGFAPGAGILEPGGKTATMAHLVDCLTASMKATPTFTAVHAKRMALVWAVQATMVGDRLTPGAATEAEGVRRLKRGDRVRRGPDWRWGQQDGGPDGRGTVISMQTWSGHGGKGVNVRWDNGTTNVYRFGFRDCYDVVRCPCVEHVFPPHEPHCIAHMVHIAPMHTWKCGRPGNSALRVVVGAPPSS